MTINEKGISEGAFTRARASFSKDAEKTEDYSSLIFASFWKNRQITLGNHIKFGVSMVA
jgi:hypothetical protein